MKTIQPPFVAAVLSRIFVEQLGVPESAVVPTATIAADLGADSLDRIELTMAIEEEFELEIPDEAAEQLVSVADVIAYVERRLRERA
jgi:acyl carrier protein